MRQKFMKILIFQKHKLLYAQISDDINNWWQKLCSEYLVIYLSEYQLFIYSDDEKFKLSKKKRWIMFCGKNFWSGFYYNLPQQFLSHTNFYRTFLFPIPVYGYECLSGFRKRRYIGIFVFFSLSYKTHWRKQMKKKHRYIYEMPPLFSK